MKAYDACGCAWLSRSQDPLPPGVNTGRPNLHTLLSGVYLWLCSMLHPSTRVNLCRCPAAGDASNMRGILTTL
eukprot:1139515-Pelagomonas_calceolata.AAC.5